MTEEEVVAGTYCGRCGRELTDGGHEDCRRALALEPPRYCADCRRRMVVQVHPMGWTARCSVHGVLEPASEDPR
ncbi:hypothetical protein PWY87_03245 [Kribbella solani]|uniref:biotin synthase auxiliary protein BsaP n=1 Tax=Kribbella solani TaxID=236067 RepID=UPI0029BC767A|nr:hypothetical protein [Kribbella solani]MDX2971617.1 hypothetical protein [Kribbella solani]MDX3000673.1 hypothetical protein [Kribbella solani]